MVELNIDNGLNVTSMLFFWYGSNPNATTTTKNKICLKRVLMRFKLNKAILQKAVWLSFFHLVLFHSVSSFNTGGIYGGT